MPTQIQTISICHDVRTASINKLHRLTVWLYLHSLNMGTAWFCCSVLGHEAFRPTKPSGAEVSILSTHLQWPLSLRQRLPFSLSSPPLEKHIGVSKYHISPLLLGKPPTSRSSIPLLMVSLQIFIKILDVIWSCGHL